MKYCSLILCLLLGCQETPIGTLMGPCRTDGTCDGVLKCQYTEFGIPHGAPYRCRPVDLPAAHTETPCQ